MKRLRFNTQKLFPFIVPFILSLITVAVVEYISGRNFLCACGYMKLWTGNVWSSENSQHLTDWYSFTHILHGIGYFFLLRFFFKKFNTLTLFKIALLIETVWEIIENNDVIINKYRESTISLDYFGDSIVNSMGDILTMSAGFYLARKLPIWGTLLIFFGVEIALLYFIRDNLTLNILMLLFPLEAIKNWQMRGL